MFYYYRFAIDYEASDPYMNFRIEPEGGGVFLKNALDRERVAKHEVHILAIDEGNIKLCFCYYRPHTKDEGR